MIHIPIIENITQFASENIKNIPLQLHHISKENFDFPDMKHIRTGFAKNNHHPKASFGLWTTNLSPIFPEKDDFYFYEASLKEKSRISLISSYSFAKMFSELHKHTFIEDELENENPALFRQNKDAYFSYLDNLINNFQAFADVLVLIDKFDDKMISKMNDTFVNTHLSSVRCEIIILNLESIQEWKKKSSLSNSPKNKQTP